MQPDPFTLGASVIFAATTFLLTRFFTKLDFAEQYTRDETVYRKACDTLHDAVRKKDDSITPALHEYLSAKLILGGVFSWSSWGRTVRLFHRAEFLVFIISGSIVVVLPALWALSSYPTVADLLNNMAIGLSFFLVFILVWEAFIMIRCRNLLAERQKRELTTEMLEKYEVARHCGLVLLSWLGGDTMKRLPRWIRSYGSYTNEELRAVAFPSVEEIERAIDFIDGESDLKGLPWDSPDGMTLFVPEEAVDLLRSKGLEFKVSELLNRGELLPGELAEMRRKYGM